MAANHQNQNKLGELLKDRIVQAQQKLETFEEEAQKVVADLVKKGEAQRKELTELIHKLNAQELFDRVPVKEFERRAKTARKDINNRLEELAERAVSFVGVASSNQVEDLARELDKLNKKLDKLARQKADKVAKA